MTVQRGDKDLIVTGDFGDDYVSPAISMDGCVFASIHIHTLGNAAGSLEVQVSNDGKNYVTLSDLNTTIADTDDQIFLDVRTHAGHVRIKFTHTSGSSQAGVAMIAKEQ